MDLIPRQHHFISMDPTSKEFLLLAPEMNVVIHPRVMNRFEEEEKLSDGSSCDDARSLLI